MLITFSRTTFLMPIIRPGIRLCTSVISCLRVSTLTKLSYRSEKSVEVNFSFSLLSLIKSLGGTIRQTSPGPEKYTVVLEGRPGRTILCTRTPSSPRTWPLAFKYKRLSSILLVLTVETYCSVAAYVLYHVTFFSIYYVLCIYDLRSYRNISWNIFFIVMLAKIWQIVGNLNCILWWKIL